MKTSFGRGFLLLALIGSFGFTLLATETASAYPPVTVANDTNFPAKVKVTFSACRSDAGDIAPHKTFSGPYRGGCLVTGARAEVIGAGARGTTLICERKYPGTTYGNFRIKLSADAGKAADACVIILEK